MPRWECCPTCRCSGRGFAPPLNGYIVTGAATRVSEQEIVAVDGVHHEYDVWVEINLGPGYTPVFVFECKNWEDRVGKNEIIVFSEKIAAAQAQHGYFVARAFTADAIAQAAKDPRIRLLMAEELPAETSVFLTNFHVVGTNDQQRTISVCGLPGQEDALARCSFGSAKASLRGAAVDLDAYARAWADELRETHNRTFPSNRMPDGVHRIELEDARTFAAGDFTIDDLVVLKLGLKLTFDLHIVWPRIGSKFEVATRGRVAFSEPVELPGAKMEFAAIDLEVDGQTGR